MAVEPIPKGYHTITPYFVTKGVPDFVEFMQRAFGAEVTEEIRIPDGRVMNVQVRIGDSMLMAGEAPDGWKPMPNFLYLYVPDCDAVYERALAAGAKSAQEPRDEFYGDRSGGVKDPFGNMWWIGTHIEDVAPDELTRRAGEHAPKRSE